MISRSDRMFSIVLISESLATIRAFFSMISLSRSDILARTDWLSAPSSLYASVYSLFSLTFI